MVKRMVSCVGMKIAIPERYIDTLRVLAEKRYEINRENSVKNMRMGDQSDAITDLEGIAGEVAFCLMFNIFPDIGMSKYSGGSPDCKTRKGNTVDIKTTKYRTGKLLERASSRSKADIYVLMVGELPTYECVGWIESYKLFKEENLVDLGHGDTYALPQSKLKSINLN